jgi:hypothetical protein
VIVLYKQSPLLGEDNGLMQCVAELSVQELIPKLAVEAIVVAILPRTTGLDEERLHSGPCESTTHELRCELRAVVRS